MGSAQEYPVRHFEMMAAAAKRMAASDIQLLEHNYDYGHFGSWWFVCSHRRHFYRCTCDGREGEMRLERSVDSRAPVWECVQSTKADCAAEADVLRDMIEKLV